MEVLYMNKKLRRKLDQLDGIANVFLKSEEDIVELTTEINEQFKDTKLNKEFNNRVDEISEKILKGIKFFD